MNCSSKTLSIKAESFTVPNAELAIKIAETKWLSVYGDVIYNSYPFKASLQNADTIWHVYGTLPKSGYSLNSNGDSVLTIVQGGVPHAIINRNNGEVLKVYHTK